MTTMTTIDRSTAVANGSAPIPFLFQSLSAAEIGVLKGGLPEAGFSVALNGDGTGTLTPDSSWGTSPVVIYSKPSYQQPTAFLRGQAFYPDQLNAPLDRLARTSIALRGAIGGTIRVPDGESLGALPNAATRANDFMQFDATGTQVALLSASAMANVLAGPMAAALGANYKGPPGSPGQGWSTLAGLATAGNTANHLDDTYLTLPGRSGKFVFYTAAGWLAAFPTSPTLATLVAADTQQGIFIAKAADPTGAGGAWVREFDGEYNVEWFGCQHRGLAFNDAPCVLAAVALLKARAVNSDGYYYSGSDELYFPAGLYNMAGSTIDLHHTIILRGASTLMGKGARLWWTVDCDGIRTQYYNTSGASGVDSPYIPLNASSYSKITQLALIGPYQDNPDFTGHTEGEFHAIHARGHYIIEDVFVDGWAGDGLHDETAVGGGGAGEGNTNCSFVNRLRVSNCRDGAHIDSADANASTFIGIIATYCRRWSVFDSSFLGNLHMGHHSANAGLVPGVAPTSVTYAGNRYSVKFGQDVGASTHAPSGDTSDNTYWLYNGAGGAASWLNIAAWVSGTTYRAGGPYLSDNLNSRTTFLNMYSEGGEPPAQFQQPAMFIGGLFGGARNPISFSTNTGNQIAGSYFTLLSGGTLGQSRVQSFSTSRTFSLWNNQPAMSNGVYAALVFEQSTEADGTTPATIGAIMVRPTTNSNTTATGVIEFYARVVAGGGTTEKIWEMNNTAGSKAFRPNVDNAWTIGLAAFRPSVVFGYTGDFTTQVKINGTKVLGAQVTGTPAAATDLASVITLANFLRSAGLAHGGIG